MMNLSENLEEYRVDLTDLINLFELDLEDKIEIKLNLDDGIWKLNIEILNSVFEFYEKEFNITNKIIFNRKIKKFVKSNLYYCLSTTLNKRLAWGALTGIRPAKLVYDKINEGKTLKQSFEELKKEYFISKEKLDLLEKVVESQTKVIANDNSYCFYVHIPICPSRCTYCSFVATDFKNLHKYLDEYVVKLREEIEYALKLVKDKNIKINSIYVGGGTPTVLTHRQLKYLLKPLANLKINEFTVECGRADTITLEKLLVLKEMEVSRISINPQTFNDYVLKTIGRNHSAQEVIDAFNLAKEFNFIINMDLIAGLPNDNLDSFKATLDKAIELNPDNITVHTLSIKNAGLLKYMDNATLPQNEEVKQMLDYSITKLMKNDFKPYYLYRQKNMLGYFENVGYAKENTECLFNIYTMEDMKPVIACGAGAISKKIHNQTNKIERVANVKQIRDYLMRFDEMLERKVYLLS